MIRRLENVNVARALTSLLAVLLVGCGSPEQRAQSYYDRGIALIAKKEDLNARVELLSALKYKDSNVETWRALAGIDERTEATSSLFQDLRRIIELDPNDLDARLKLANLMLRAGAADAALKMVELAKEGNAPSAPLHAMKATILLRTNDPAAAVQEAKKAVEIDPSNAQALVVLSSEKLSRGDAAGALSLLEGAPGAAKSDRRVAIQKVQALAKEGELVQAETLLGKLVAEDPRDASLRSLLIQLHIAMRRFDEAEKELRGVASANPSDSKAGIALVRFIITTKGAEAGREELASRIKAGGDIFPYQLALAELDFGLGNFTQATQLLKSLVSGGKTSENKVAAQVKLAEMYLSKRNITDAEAALNEILQKDRRNTTALRLRATIRIEQSQFDNAIADLREALNDQPKSPELLVLLATAYERSGKAELAERQYADALKSSGANPRLALSYAAFLQRKGSTAQAEEVLNDAAGRNPRNVELLSALAQVRLSQRKWTAATAVADEIQAIGNNEAVADQIRAAALAGQNKIDESIAELEKAHSSAPDAVQPVVSLVGAYISKGQPAKAVALLSDMLKKFPSNAQLLVLMGQTQIASRKPEEGVKNFNAAIAAQPKSELGYVALSDFYLGQRNFEEAAKTTEAGLKELPDNINLRLRSAGLLIAKGDHEGAISAYEAILRTQPKALVAINNLVSLLVDNRSDRASLEHAITLAEPLRNEKVPEFQDTLGWAEYKRGNSIVAITLLEEAATKLPNSAVVRYHLAQAYSASGQTAKAAQQLTAALAIEPEGTELKEKIRAAMK